MDDGADGRTEASEDVLRVSRQVDTDEVSAGENASEEHRRPQTISCTHDTITDRDETPSCQRLKKSVSGEQRYI